MKPGIWHFSAKPSRHAWYASFCTEIGDGHLEANLAVAEVVLLDGDLVGGGGDGDGGVDLKGGSGGWGRVGQRDARGWGERGEKMKEDLP